MSGLFPTLATKRAEEKKDNSSRGYPFVKYGACAKYSLFPTKKQKSTYPFVIKMFDKATFFRFLINFKTDAVGYHFRTQGMFATSK